MNIFDLPVHPAAAIWPMIDDEGLQRLAADIKANGQLDPITIGSDEQGELVLIDGRNRLAACKIAHVDPTYENIGPQNPVDFIVSKNDGRRHMSAGARAMCLAETYPDARHGGDKTKLNNSTCSSVDKGYLSKARAVLKWAPDLVHNVKHGTLTLIKAQEEAKIREQSASSDEARMEALREEAPDLADRVVDGEFGLRAAEAELEDRKEAAHIERIGVWEIAKRIDMLALGFDGTNGVDLVVDVIEKYPDEAPVSDLKSRVSIAIKSLTQLEKRL